MSKLTKATCTRDVLEWIVAHDHHEGWWSGPHDALKAFHLRGRSAELVIPASVHVPGMMEPDDFKATGRMYRPSDAGRLALEDKP